VPSSADGSPEVGPDPEDRPVESDPPAGDDPPSPHPTDSDATTMTARTIQTARTIRTIRTIRVEHTTRAIVVGRSAPHEQDAFGVVVVRLLRLRVRASLPAMRWLRIGVTAGALLGSAWPDVAHAG
jgi:hypothetical protein